MSGHTAQAEPLSSAAQSHTPGPWTHHHQPYDVQGGSGLNDSIFADGEVLFLLAGGLNEVRRADCRLVAAAPDLLEALETLISDFEDYPASEKPCHGFILARAAIAKATGSNDSLEASRQNASDNNGIPP